MDDEFFGRMFFSAEKVFGRTLRRRPSTPKSSFFNHFKKFARRANFLKCCRGGVWTLGGRSPPQESPLPVPCPRALPPISFRPKNFSTKILFCRKNFPGENFSAENFGRKFFGRKNFRFFDRNFFSRKTFRPKMFSSEFFSSVHPFVRPSSVRPPSVEKY